MRIEVQGHRIQAFFIELHQVLEKKQINGVCLKPHGRSENFINARFIIRNKNVVFVLYSYSNNIYNIYNYNCA
jgi:hypothetical protein